MKVRLPLKPDAQLAQPGTRLDDPETWPEFHVCESVAEQHEPRFASRRLHLPTGPIEFCDPCAEWALKVYGTLGCHVHVENLPLGVMIDRVKAVGKRLMPEEES